MILSNSFTSFDSVPAACFASAPPQRRYSMQAAQLEVWLSSQQSPAANCAYNEIATLELSGQLNIPALQLSLQALVQRHGSLRATFDRQSLEVVEHAYQPPQMDMLDWQSHSPAQVQQLRQQLIAQLGSTPFDLERGPLFRAALQRVSATENYLTIAAHHLVLDGWSLNLVVQDLGKFYDQFHTHTEAPAPEPACVYAEYARAMQAHTDSESGQQDLAYWLGQFADGAPTLDLPISGGRGALRSYSASRIEHWLPAELVQALRTLGAKNGCSLYNTLLAAFQAFIARLGQTQDVVLAIPTAGQSAMDLAELVGHCVNTLPIRLAVDNQRTFSEHLRLSRSTLLSGLDHQRFSYGELLKHLKGQRDPSRPPLCSVSFNLDPVVDFKQAGFMGLDVQLLVEPRAFENFEWFVNGIIHHNQSIELQVQFNRDLFQAQTISYYMEGFQAYLEYLVDHPESRLFQVPMMSLAQRQRLLVDWNGTDMDVPRHSNLPSEFTRQARATPERVAVRWLNHQLTYSQLDAQSSLFARYLNQRGVKQGDLVGICSPRTPRLLIQVLGILKAGAGYVPLDPQYPTERLRMMCDDSQLKLIVCEQELVEKVAAFGKTTVTFDEFSRGDVSLQTDATDDLSANLAASDVCYVIYTSGSTGKPKGVMVPHGAVVNFLYSMRQQPGYVDQDNVLAVTTLSFDIAVLELYLPLVFGGTVILADWETTTDGKKLIAAVEREDIRLMQATPATWRMMIASGWSGKRDLKILCGGEPMTRDLAASLLERCGELWNMYGPTETTVWSTLTKIQSADAPILIGRPIANTQVYLLDANGQEVPVGVEGEIMIGGAGVTLGYWNRPELTGERFVDNPYFNPFTEYVNHRLYKTGDIAVYTMDGNIEYRRRNDKQIKLRGYRIELGEIESALRGFSSVDQAVVLVRNDQPGDSRLVAYLTAPSGIAIDLLREHLRQHLPHYMIPQHYVVLQAMPLTSNGKIDLNALPAPEAQPVQSSVAACETASELFLAEVWKNVLHLDQVSRNDNFFDIGGHSLLVMQVINQVESTTGNRLSPQEFLLGTLEQLATQLDDVIGDNACVSTPSIATHSDATHSSEPTKISTITQSIAPLVAEFDTPTPAKPASLFDCLKRFWS